MPVYITPEGYKKIVEEYNWLHSTERPRITAEVSYAASLGDRSENSEYLYGKKRLREIDKRIHFLRTRLEKIEPVDPAQFSGDAVLFGGSAPSFSVRLAAMMMAQVRVSAASAGVSTCMMPRSTSLDQNAPCVSRSSRLSVRVPLRTSGPRPWRAR